MSVMTISEKGWVVIPKAFRQKYHLRPGDQVRLVDYGGGLAIVPVPADPVAALRGMLADGPSLTADLLADRQQAKTQEDADA
jgi:AbrB family looped-hinge helix DNA binding protein